jgi:hypothetical protein
MWPFKKKGISLQPGESKDLFFEVPKDKKIGELVMTYDDEYGNKYETRAIVNVEERKIIRQDYKIIKNVKDIPEKDRPRLVVHEKDLENEIRRPPVDKGIEEQSHKEINNEI